MLGLPESVVLNNKQYKIQSPEGLVDFLGVNKITKDSYIHLKFTNGKELKCSEDHPISTSEGIIRAKNLTKKIEIETIDGYCFATSKRHIKRKIDLYDIVNSGTQHLYYSNGIVSHNCEFLGSTNTLISGSKLQMLRHMNAIDRVGDMDIYEYPVKENDEGTVKDHLYAMCVDISEGKNLDASTFSVIDVSTIPYRQVAKYHNRTISPLLFPTVIYNAAKYYNDAYILVEINNTPQIAETLHSDFEYENVIKIQSGNKKAQQISAGFGRGVQVGVRMTPLVKRVGCANLKTLIESDKLIVNDFVTISELTTFVADKQSFAAEEGTNDDMVMTLVLFAWMTTQKYFKDIVSHDIRKQLQLQHFSQVDEEMLPVGEVQDGKDVPFIVEGGDVWVTGSGDVYASYFDEITRGL